MFQPAVQALQGTLNSTFKANLAITLDGNTPDFTGWTFRMDLKSTLGVASAALLTARNNAPGAGKTQITCTTPTSGVIGVYIAQADIAALPMPSNVSSPGLFNYDIIGKDQTGDEYNLVGGVLTIAPGVSSPA